MDSRNEGIDEEKFTPPHQEFTGFLNQKINRLMQETYKSPTTMKKIPMISGGISTSLMVTAVIPNRIPRPIKAGFFIAGAAGAFVSLTSSLFQHKIFGFPVGNDALYQETSFNFRSAEAKLLVDDIHFPRLNIRATHPYDAGYVEGYVLGNAIRENLNSDAIRYLFKLVYIVIGFPNEEQYRAYFTDILDTIPEEYKDEMRGKKDGYNAYCLANYPNEKQLSFEKYAFFQFIADYVNYLPLAGCRFAPLLQYIGCTTFALRVGNASFFTRVLDWLGYGKAGYFIEIQKQIAGKPTITDIAHPLLSGALTVRNSRMLFQMNVAPGRKVQDKPTGMPAVFFNRYCAENILEESEFDSLLSRKQPVSAYHLIYSGLNTGAIHFFQDHNDRKKHLFEKLNPDKTAPQLLVVANNGIQEKEGKVVPFNYRDSDERKENIYTFFKQRKIQEQLKSYIAKQNEGYELSPEDFSAIREKIILPIARLPLVCNPASVLCAVFEEINGELREAYAAVNNSFAPNRPQFKKLRP